MARWIGAGALLACFALVQLVAADDYDICTYRNSGCTEDEECTDGDNGDCEDVDVDDTLQTLGAVVNCNIDDSLAAYQLWFDDDCDGESDMTGVIEPNRCERFLERDIWFTIVCDTNDPCFSGESYVNLADGSQKKVSEVQVGDLVESFTADGRHTFSEVFLIQHKENDKFMRMKKYHYEAVDGSVSGAITLTKRHLVRRAADQDLYMASQEIQKGHRIMVQVAGKESAVEATVVEITRSYGAIRNILTMNDRIVVDGVLASTGTDILPLWMQKMLTGPLKMMYSVGLGEVASSLDTFVHKAFVSYKKGSISS